ncbi:MAG: sigma-70 family RNA polymerase sigma factor [Myxococcales bacterium]|nr:sigma-70 family RNA polymerase sigma factor [Myxococcales bacterium]
MERGAAASPAPGASPEDIALVQRLLAGEEAAFASLVDQYHSGLLRLAMMFLADRAGAEEVLQETWVAVLEGLSSFEGRSSLKTWVFGILANRARTRAVREGRSVPFSSLAEAGREHEPAVDPSRFQPNGGWAEPPRHWENDTPEKLVMRREALRRLELAIAELPANQRAVVTLRDVDGLDSKEVCNVLEISETNQRVLLHRARSKLRRVLEDCVDWT